MTALPGNSPGDGYGHGTFVAGIAAGSATATPARRRRAHLVSLDVMDDQGMALTSDVIAAADWILRTRTRTTSASRTSRCTRPRPRACSGIRSTARSRSSGSPVSSSSRPRATTRRRPAERRPLRARQRPVRHHRRRRRHRRHGLDRETTRRRRGRPTATRSTASRSPRSRAPGRYLVGPVPIRLDACPDAPDERRGVRTTSSSPARLSPRRSSRERRPTCSRSTRTGRRTRSRARSCSPRKATPQRAPLSAASASVDAARALELTDTPPNPNLALDRFVVADPSDGTARSSTPRAGAAPPRERLLGRRVLGRCFVGRCLVGLGLLGRHRMVGRELGHRQLGRRAWATRAGATPVGRRQSWGDVSWGATSYADNASADGGAPDLARRRPGSPGRDRARDHDQPGWIRLRLRPTPP